MTLTASGFNPLLEYNKIARDEGYFALFQQRAIENIKSYQVKSKLLMSLEQDSRGSAEFQKFLLENSQNKTKVHLIIYPYHVQMLAMFEQFGMLSTFEHWKHSVLREINILQKSHPEIDIKLWDFSGYSDFQCERIPKREIKNHDTMVLGSRTF